MYIPFEYLQWATSEFQNTQFQNKVKCTTLLVKMSFICMSSISEAEHLTSFWYKGPEKLGNGLLNRLGIFLQCYIEVLCNEK